MYRCTTSLLNSNVLVGPARRYFLLSLSLCLLRCKCLDLRLGASLVTLGTVSWSLSGILILSRKIASLSPASLPPSPSPTRRDYIITFLLLPPPLLSAHLVVPPRGPLECGEAGGARAAQPQHMKAQKYNKQAHSIKVNMLSMCWTQSRSQQIENNKVTTVSLLQPYNSHSHRTGAERCISAVQSRHLNTD